MTIVVFAGMVMLTSAIEAAQEYHVFDRFRRKRGAHE